jgi:hypothetical protein
MGVRSGLRGGRPLRPQIPGRPRLIPPGWGRFFGALADSKKGLIAMGYMADLAGRLRMTTPGRIRIYAGQLAG